ncbi:MAG: hypothetical protein WAT81_02790 [Candidatus Moraniibacteriota bacterium]
MDISLYVGEVMLIFALVLHILEYIIELKSIEYSKFKNEWKSLFHVELLVIVTGILLFLNLTLSIDLILSLTTFFHWLILVYFLYQIRELYVSRGTSFIESVFYILLLSVFIQFLIASYQVVNGSSIGLNFLNESVLSLNGINIAKSHIASTLILRGYGTFPHPNVLSAYLIYFIIFINVFSNKLFHVKQYFKYLALVISFSTVLLTQSKVSMVFVFVYGIYFITKKYQFKKMFHVEYMVLISLMLVLLYSTFQIDINNSVKTRIEQYKFQEVGKNLSLFGSGLGTYRLTYDTVDKQWWNFEPVHFVPVLFLKELGVLLTLFTLICIIMKYKDVPRGTIKSHFLSIVFLTYILSTDHYAWDIYQGMFLCIVTIAQIIHIDKKHTMYHNIH